MNGRRRRREWCGQPSRQALNTRSSRVARYYCLRQYTWHVGRTFNLGTTARVPVTTAAALHQVKWPGWKIRHPGSRPGSALPIACFASVIVWTENKYVTTSDRWPLYLFYFDSETISAALAAFVFSGRRLKKVVNFFLGKSASGWPSSRMFWPRNDLAPVASPGFRGWGQSWSVGSPPPPSPLFSFPSFLSLLPSPSFLTFPLFFFFSIFPSQNPARGSGGALQAPPAGPGAQPRPPKHFCHILRPEDVLVAMILVLFAQIKISIWIKIDRTGCYSPYTSYDYF